MRLTSVLSTLAVGLLGMSVAAFADDMQIAVSHGNGQAGDGQSVTFKAGEPHKFWNAGTDELHCKGWVRPPHNIEYFLTAIYESTKDNGGKMPHPADAAYLLNRYKSEFGMLDIPGFVQRFIFPLQLGIGKLTGRYRKYQDAPAPHRFPG